MKDTIRAEWRKLRTTRTGKGLLAATVALTALGAWGTLHEMGPATSTASTIAALPLFLLATWSVSILAMVLGIRSVTDEVRHGSLVPTLLATPDRRRVVGAKLAVAATAGAVLGLAAIATGTAFAMIWTATHGGMLALGGTAFAILALKVAAVGAAWAAIGLGIGLIVRHQVAAIVGALVYLFVVEDLIGGLFRGVAKFLPGSAADAFIGMSAGGAELVAPVVGAVLLAGYAALSMGVGTERLVRGDIS